MYLYLKRNTCARILSFPYPCAALFRRETLAEFGFQSFTSVHERKIFLRLAGFRFGAMAKQVGTFSGCSTQR